MPHDTELDTEAVFTVQNKPKIIELDGYIGAHANQTEAFALCERLLSAVRDFNRAEPQMQK